MAVPQRIKNAINERLNTAMGTLAVDYLASRLAFEPVVTALALRGWRLNREGASPELQRLFVVSVTRSAEHQALVEREKEVASGESTYERAINQVCRFKLGSSIGDGARTVVIDEVLPCLALAALAAHARGVRPATRLRDLT